MTQLRPPRPLDIGLIAAAPALLVLIHVAPDALRDALVLNRATPTPLALFTNHYVHADDWHLAGNLLTFLPAAATLYALSDMARARRLFRTYLVTILLLFPLLLSTADLLFFEAIGVTSGTSQGFSGISAATIGLLPVPLTAALRKNLTDRIRTQDAIGLYLLSLAGIPLTYWQGPGTAAALLVILLLAALYLRAALRRARTDPGLGKRFNALAADPLRFAAVLVSTWLVLAMPLILFPADITQRGTVVNVFTHYAGFTLGFLLPLFTWGRLLDPGRH